MSFLFLDQKNQAKAQELAGKAQSARLKILANILSFTSEQQRLAYQAMSCRLSSDDPYVLFATMGSAPEIASTVLHHKGVVPDSLLEDRLVAQASKRPEDRALIDQLRAAKQRLTQLLLEVPKDFSPEARARREKERDKLAAEVEQLEGTLARHVSGLGRARRALSVTVQQVQKAIPKQAVLLELLRYSHHLGADKHEPRYGAVVIAASGEPKWIPLGSAAAIETNIVLYQNAVRGSAAAAPTPVGALPPGTNHPGSQSSSPTQGFEIRNPQSAIRNRTPSLLHPAASALSTTLGAD